MKKSTCYYRQINLAKCENSCLHYLTLKEFKVMCNIAPSTAHAFVSTFGLPEHIRPYFEKALCLSPINIKVIL